MITTKRKTVTRTKATVSAQHAATLEKSIAEQLILYSFAAKETVTTKGKTIWKSYQSKERPLRRWSPSSTILYAVWMPSAGGMEKKTMSEWMDNQDVCRMLNISPRTLQTLRDNGTLAYSQINHKNLLPSRRCEAYRFHRGGQTKGSEVQGQDNLITE